MGKSLATAPLTPLATLTEALIDSRADLDPAADPPLGPTVPADHDRLSPPPDGSGWGRGSPKIVGHGAGRIAEPAGFWKVRVEGRERLRPSPG